MGKNKHDSIVISLHQNQIKSHPRKDQIHQLKNICLLTRVTPDPQIPQTGRNR